MKQANRLIYPFLLYIALSCAFSTNNEASLKAAEAAMKSAASSTSARAYGFKTVLDEWSDQQRNRQIPVKLYIPDASGPFPLVIFSHGLGGSREAAPYLGEYWAKKGYLGVFIQHPGSDSSVWQTVERKERMNAMHSAANAKNLVDRGTDVIFVLDELERRQNSGELKGKLDLSRIAVSGHSFGAGTSLLLAGQNVGLINENPRFLDQRIKAAIYLCPPVSPLAKRDPSKSFGSIKIPGMLLTGTEDDSPIGNTSAEDRRIPFDGMKAPHQYLINFYGADHAVFGGGKSYRAAKDNDEKFRLMVQELTGKFLDATLRSDETAWAWLDKGAAAKYLANKADYEKK